MARKPIRRRAKGVSGDTGGPEAGALAGRQKISLKKAFNDPKIKDTDIEVTAKKPLSRYERRAANISGRGKGAAVAPESKPRTMLEKAGDALAGGVKGAVAGAKEGRLLPHQQVKDAAKGAVAGAKGQAVVPKKGLVNRVPKLDSGKPPAVDITPDPAGLATGPKVTQGGEGTTGASEVPAAPGAAGARNQTGQSEGGSVPLSNTAQGQGTTPPPLTTDPTQSSVTPAASGAPGTAKTTPTGSITTKKAPATKADDKIVQKQKDSQAAALAQGVQGGTVNEADLDPKLVNSPEYQSQARQGMSQKIADLEARLQQAEEALSAASQQSEVDKASQSASQSQTPGGAPTGQAGADAGIDPQAQITAQTEQAMIDAQNGPVVQDPNWAPGVATALMNAGIPVQPNPHIYAKGRRRYGAGFGSVWGQPGETQALQTGPGAPIQYQDDRSPEQIDVHRAEADLELAKGEAKDRNEDGSFTDARQKRIDKYQSELTKAGDDARSAAKERRLRKFEAEDKRKADLRMYLASSAKRQGVGFAEFRQNKALMEAQTTRIAQGDSGTNLDNAKKLADIRGQYAKNKLTDAQTKAAEAEANETLEDIIGKEFDRKHPDIAEASSELTELIKTRARIQSMDEVDRGEGDLEKVEKDIETMKSRLKDLREGAGAPFVKDGNTYTQKQLQDKAKKMGLTVDELKEQL